MSDQIIMLKSLDQPVVMIETAPRGPTGAQGPNPAYDVLANRPTAAAAGDRAFFVATDVNGGTLYQVQTGAWVAIANMIGFTNPLTTTQDILVGGAAGVPARLGAGANGQALELEGGLLVWQAPLKPLLANTVGVAQATIAHGLGRVPSIVVICMTSAGTVWRSAASDGTNVYVTADAAARTCDIFVR